jgi:NAD(P)-dependent dehydrogenase (short-subunit alcohol dehydrogenase family)
VGIVGEKKVAVITGASQGIGAGLVEAFTAIGYAVVANSRSITEGRSHLVSVAGDIADRAVAERVIATRGGAVRPSGHPRQQRGRVRRQAVHRHDQADYDRTTRTNLLGFFGVTQAALTQMVARGFGHVVNVTTSLVEFADSNVPSVLASLTKGGLSAATKSLAIEYASRGIRVNAVSPGIIQTPLHDPSTFDTLAGLHPMRRMGAIRDVVDGILYLERAGFVTGELLHVDGGQSAGR